MINHCDLSVSGVNKDDWDAQTKRVRVICPCGKIRDHLRQLVLKNNKSGFLSMLCNECRFPRKQVVCERCGKSFERLVSLCQDGRNSYCTSKCYLDHSKEKAKVFKKCRTCQMDFAARKWDLKEFCSQECRWTEKPLEPCLGCGIPCPKSRRYCSVKCSSLAGVQKRWANRPQLHPYVDVEQCIKAGDLDSIDCVCYRCAQPFQVKSSTIRQKWMFDPIRAVCPKCLIASQQRKDVRKKCKPSPKGKHINRRIKDQKGCCDDCGLAFAALLDTHHRDGNNHNNKKENLEVLCKNCHGCRHLLRSGDSWIFQSSNLTPLDEIPNWRNYPLGIN